MYVFTALLLHGMLKGWVALEASRQLGTDRHNGALELLLCTPLDVPTILRGQWLAIVRQFAGPVCVVCVADLVFRYYD